MTTVERVCSRRRFLSTVAAGTGAAVRVRSEWARAVLDPGVANILAKTIGIDTHNHIYIPLTDAEMPGPDLDLKAK